MGGMSVCTERTGFEYDVRNEWELDSKWEYLTTDTYMHHGEPYFVVGDVIIRSNGKWVIEMARRVQGTTLQFVQIGWISLLDEDKQNG
jgi:hypothetical protein